MANQNNNNPQKRPPQNPKRLGVIGNDMINMTRSNFSSIPRHSADVILPEQKIISSTQRKKAK